MREIKFRAWDGSTMLDDVIPLAKRTIVAQNGYNTIDQVQYGWRIETDIWNYSDFEFMQYTGLKDKNGKEIFEGDILLTDDKYHDFQDGIAISELPDGRLVPVTFSDGAFWVENELLYEHALYWEVVGNIYENPELMEAPNGN